MTKAKSTTTTTTVVPATDGWGADSQQKYAKLAGAVEYDHEAAEQLASALNEIVELELKSEQLKQLVKENEELHQFVWRTADNITVALHNIGNDHLGNIMLHLLRAGRAIPRAIRGEAIKRGIVIPAVVPVGWTEDDLEYSAQRRIALSTDRKDVV